MHLNEFLDQLNEGIFSRKSKESADPEKAEVESKAQEIVDRAMKMSGDLETDVADIIDKLIDKADPEMYDFYYEVEERALALARKKSK